MRGEEYEKTINVNYDKLKSKSSNLLPLVVSCFLFKWLEMSYDKLFAAHYKIRKICLSVIHLLYTKIPSFCMFL